MLPGAPILLLLAAEVGPSYERDVEPLLVTYCYDCHGEGSARGDVAFDEFPTPEARRGDRTLWTRVWENVRNGVMPPRGRPRPDAAGRARLQAWIRGDVQGVDCRAPDPGRVALRRLNRDEYDASVADLFGIDEPPADDLPADDSGYGFDNVGEVLSVSPLLTEKYFAAAERIARRVLASEPARRRLFFDGPPPRDPAARRQYARAILERVAARAFRRPCDPATVDRLLILAERVRDFDRGIAVALEAVLTSPRFLFHVEEAPAAGGGPAAPALDDHALAARLASFLLGSIPDDELTAVTARGELREQLPAQVARLLADGRSNRFVARFVGQWLRTRDLEALSLSGRLARVLTPRLRGLMRRETEMLFASLMREDRDVMELVTADYTFLNEALARYYELPPVAGGEMRRVALPADAHRGGLLTQGSFLAVTSNPTRTSPVKRGLFVLDNLLGAPPPPPPPNVPNLEEAVHDRSHPTTVREQLAVHRQAPACAACHARMDPIGLALEGYDSLGRWRQEEDGRVIDVSGQLPTGETVQGADGLRAFLVGRREQVYRALTRKLMIFALGRGLEPADECTVDALVDRMMAGGGRLSALILGIAQSPPFQQRRVAVGGAP